jgi:multidrug efflux system membrane fusion protein
MKITPYSQWIAQRPYIIAAFITLFLFLWMASGPSEAEQKSALKAAIPANNEQKNYSTSESRNSTQRKYP